MTKSNNTFTSKNTIDIVRRKILEKYGKYDSPISEVDKSGKRIVVAIRKRPLASNDIGQPDVLTAVNNTTTAFHRQRTLFDGKTVVDTTLDTLTRPFEHCTEITELEVFHDSIAVIHKVISVKSPNIS